MTTYTANQPLMLGGSIYMWNRYDRSDCLIHMVEAQFTKFGHQSRIELANYRGEPQWFIVPLANRSFKQLNEVYLAEPDKTATKLQASFDQLYSQKTCVEPELKARILDTFNTYKNSDLSTLNVAVTDLIYYYLFDYPYSKRSVISTDIAPVREDNPSKWVAQLGVSVGASVYLGGGVAQAAYLKEEDFSSNGMELQVQDYKLEPYKVGRVKGVDLYQSSAYVSILDPLFRLGKEETLKLIQA